MQPLRKGFDMSEVVTIMIILIIGVLTIPRRFDPAIRLKEWMIRKGWAKW